MLDFLRSLIFGEKGIQIHKTRTPFLIAFGLELKESGAVRYKFYSMMDANLVGGVVYVLFVLALESKPSLWDGLSCKSKDRLLVLAFGQSWDLGHKPEQM